MTRKQLITGTAAAVCAAAAIALLRNAHRTESAEDSGEALPSLVTVQVGQLRRATLHGYVDAFGRIEPAPAGEDQAPAAARVASPVAGVVAGLGVAEGQRVEKGTLLVQLNSQVADVAVTFARKALERQQRLLQLNDTSQKAVQDAQQQLAAAEAQAALLRITAPLSGTVTHLYTRPGEAVDLNTIVADITDLNRLAVAVEIPSEQAAALENGQEVELLTTPGIHSRLSYVGPSVNTTNDTVLARASIPFDSELRPGQFVRVRIVTAVSADCLVAPEKSVVAGTNGQSVIAVVSGDEASQVPVKTGLRENGRVEVSGPGLREGETVVTVGAYGLPPRTKIQVAGP